MLPRDVATVAILVIPVDGEFREIPDSRRGRLIDLLNLGGRRLTPLPQSRLHGPQRQGDSRRRGQKVHKRQGVEDEVPPFRTRTLQIVPCRPTSFINCA